MAIEGKSEKAQGPIRYGMVGGGQGAFIGGVHRIAARMDGEFQLVAGALSSDPARAKASAAELGLDPERSYGTYQEMAKAEAKPQGRHRGGRHRHAQPHAFRPGEGFPRSRHPRHLRQAADLHAGRRQETRGDRRKDRQAVRADPQLHRLSDDPAGPRHGPEGRARRHPRRAVRISAGLADHQHRGEPARSRRRGASIPSSRASAARPATSARMPTISPASSAASSWIRSPPISIPSCRAARSTTTPTCCCASKPRGMDRRPRA